MRSLIAAILLLSGSVGHANACSSEQGPFLREITRATKACAHALCGQIYATEKDEAAIPEAPCSDESWTRLKRAASSALASGGVLILGEIHDNATHHRLQAAAIEELALQSPENVTAIVFEQLRDDQQAGIDKFLATEQNGRPVTVADLKQRINWRKSGWPDLYDPLFENMLAARRPFSAGDVSRAEIMKAARGGEEALPPADRKHLGLDVPLGDTFDAASIKEIAEAHCGALPKEAFGGMAYAQRYRDAHLADALLKAIQRNGSAILIAGAGHARTDRAVPWYIRERTPGMKVVSVMFVEVEDGNTDPEAYVPRDPEGRPAADFLIFTPRAERDDPCAKMRKK